jgi:O-antigen ligase
VNSLVAAIFAAAFVFIQCYISGTRLAYSIPAYILIAVAGVLTLFARSDARRQISKWCIGATVVCFGYLIWRNRTSPVEYLARQDFYSMLACLVVYGLTVAFVTDRRLRMGIITVMLGLAVVQAMFGVFQYADRPEWLPFNLEHSPSVQRGRGSFISSIHFAGYLEAIAPFALAIAFWGSRTPWIRWMAGSIAVLSYFAIGLSGSRGAWLSSAFSLIIFIIISVNATRKVQRERFPAAIYLAVLTVFALPFGLYYLMQQSEGVRRRLEALERIGAVKLQDYDIRIYNWQAAVEQWQQQPVLGTGAGTHLIYGRLFRRPQLQPDPIHAHSDYLELLAEYGIIGASVVGIFLIVHLGAGIRGHGRLLALRRDDPYRSSPELALNIGALTAVAAYFAHSAVDFNLHLPGNALLFAFIFGLLANPSVPNRTGDEEDPAAGYVYPRWWARPIVPGLAALLVALVAPLYPGEYYASRARIANREGRYDEGAAHAQRALTYEQRNPFIYLYLGQAYRLNATRRIPDPAELKKAKEAYLAGLAVFEMDETLWVRLAQTLDALGEYRDARRAYERAIQLDPKLAILYGYYARHLEKVGRHEEAKAALAEGHKYAISDLSVFLQRSSAADSEEPVQPR